MNIGWVLGTAARGVRRRRVWMLGGAIALLGLVYVAVDSWARLYNKNYLDDLVNNLGDSVDLPTGLGWVLLAGVAVAALGGLASEGGLITSVGRRLVTHLPPPPARPASVSGFRRFIRLLGVAGWVWWPWLLVGVLGFAPVGALLASPEQSSGWALALLGCTGCTSLLLLLGWWILWPLNRLANCAALFDNLPARQAARTARSLARANLGSVLGLWFSVSVLNLVLVSVSLGLAALGAAVVWGVLQGVNAVAPDASLVGGGLAALLVGLLLLAWDGAVTAFTLNTWVLAYYSLRSRVTAPVLLSTGTQPAGQALGRLRLPPTGL